MNNIVVFSKRILIAGICMLLLQACSSTNSEDNLPTPKIVAGTAKVAGKVVGFQREKGKNLPDLLLFLPHPVTAEIAYYQTALKEDGSFSFEVPVEISPVFGSIKSEILKSESYSDGVCFVALAANETTQLEIIKKDSVTKVNMPNSLGLTSDDVVNLVEVASELAYQVTYSGDEKIKPEDYSIRIINRIDEIMKTVVDNNSKLSNRAKQLLSINYKLFFQYMDLFHYTRKMYYAFLDNPENKGKSEADFIPTTEPNRSYYSFLKHCNLNNPLYLYAYDYYTILDAILSNDTLNIQPIKDIPIKDWLVEVKNTMADLVGSSTGLFYDMLAANAYAKQMKDENRPLSDKQKENISNYFKNPSFAKILFSESDKIIQRAENQKQFSCNH